MYRIGFSSDIHRLVRGRQLILGGINIPFDKGSLAHSDGDVVMHAISEAILGALSLGDLGEHFPDSDSSTENMDSSIILKYVMKLMEKSGFEINNIDVSIQLERPKLSEYKVMIRENLSKCLDININRISIKAGTNEQMDSVGSGLAIKADAIVLLKKKDDTIKG